MKNMLIGKLCVCLLFLLSCKKEQQSNLPTIKADEKKFAVKFNVSDFQQQVEAMSSQGGNKLMSVPGITSADSLKNHINNLLYLAYDSAGNEVGRIRQYTYEGSYKYNYEPYIDYWKPYDKPFGSMVDSLPSGKYTIIFVGSTYAFTISDRHKFDPTVDDRLNLQMAYLSEESTLSWLLSYTGDTFVKKCTLNVNNQNTQQDVQLDRVTGKLEVHILDAIPAEADKFEFRYVGAANGIKLSTMEPQGGTYYDQNSLPPFPTVQIKPSEKGTTNYQYSKFLFGREQSVTVEIWCYDAAGKALASKIVTGVPMFKNKRTILKGKLFDNGSEASFNVSVNSEWDPNPVEVPF